MTPPPWAQGPAHTGGTPPLPPPPPTYVQPPHPVPPPPGPRRLLVILTAMAVLGSGIGAGVWFVTRDGSTGAGGTPGPGVVVTTSPPETTPGRTTPAETTPPASPLDSAPPSPSTGYRRAEDPVGYTIFVPEDWIRRQQEGEKAPVVFYDAPDDGRQLQIFRLAEDTPAESLRLAENDPGYGFARQPGYQALERDEGTTWSELTYRYDDEDKGSRQVIDHRFEATDGTLYAIRASGPADLPVAQIREPLTTALGSFCPEGGPCQ
ncbi:hypothetical protein [Streptomyces sp. S.PB5]|uniref:hypothetical protein n=1 Tax=Streptomyces sp. S.PB5 TaxID=3020844 RepID=UPI0025B0007B|nr:hypothetical protein [Streptomyces sp. S.PB5]MDN3024510.1 hypothetical protein [Streptomyces sp. S.PB5]